MGARAPFQWRGRPLAVVRKQTKELPPLFTLDGATAIARTAKIRGHEHLVLSTRISKSGNAQPQRGDLSGQSAAAAPGVEDIVIQTSQIVGN